MSETHPTDLYSTPLSVPVQVTYVDDVPDVRQWLIGLRRDLVRKIKQLDELIARLPVDTERLK